MTFKEWLATRKPGTKLRAFADEVAEDATFPDHVLSLRQLRAYLACRDASEDRVREAERCWTRYRNEQVVE